MQNIRALKLDWLSELVLLVPTRSFFKFRQRGFIYIIVNSGWVGVVADEQQVTDVWVD